MHNFCSLDEEKGLEILLQEQFFRALFVGYFSQILGHKFIFCEGVFFIFRAFEPKPY